MRLDLSRALHPSAVYGRPSVAPVMTLHQRGPKIAVRAVEQSDCDQLARICTDSFFGTHSFTDGPVIFLQRLLILLRVRQQLTRRIGFESDDRECRMVVAEDTASGRVCGVLDLAVHLYDRDQQRFWLTIDSMPDANPLERNRWAWQPYLASIAVRSSDRRRGVAKRLVGEAERVAKQWGYNDLYLEVAQSNEPALNFYRRKGYRVVKDWERGKAGAGAQLVTRSGFWWEVNQDDKFIMQKSLMLTFGQSSLA